MKNILIITLSFLVLSCQQNKPKPPAKQAAEDSMKVLVANYELNEISLEDHAALGEAVAPDFSPDNIEGLIGKTFIGNVDTGNFGGVYYFKNQASLDAFLGSELLAGVKAHPNLANFTTHQFDVAGISSVTNGLADQRKTSANREDAAEMHVLIANYELNEISLEDHAALGKAVAPDFSPDNIDGLIGKTFIGNVDTGIFGGVYYFETKASLDAFLGSELLAGVKAHPNLANFTTRQFGVAGVSALTNGIPSL